MWINSTHATPVADLARDYVNERKPGALIQGFNAMMLQYNNYFEIALNAIRSCCQYSLIHPAALGFIPS